MTVGDSCSTVPSRRAPSSALRKVLLPAFLSPTTATRSSARAMRRSTAEIAARMASLACAPRSVLWASRADRVTIAPCTSASSASPSGPCDEMETRSGGAGSAADLRDTTTVTVSSIPALFLSYRELRFPQFDQKIGEEHRCQWTHRHQRCPDVRPGIALISLATGNGPAHSIALGGLH